MAKFRFHWGWGIAIFYSLFVIVLLIIVIRSFSVDNSLVVDDYYSYDITYQEHADKLKNSRELEKDVEFDFDQKELVLNIIFPEGFKEYDGTILFYKPDNKKLDFELNVKPDSNAEQVIDVGDLVRGYWRIKIDWQGDSKEFYREDGIYIQ